MAITEERGTSVRWSILALLFGLAFVAYVLRMNISVLAELIMPEFGISELQMGLVYGTFTWGYALFQFPGGVFGERIGPRRALALITILWGVATLLTGALPGVLFTTASGALAVFIGVRLFMGIVQAPIFPIQAGVVASWFPVSRWALPTGLIGTGLGLGAAATPPVVAWLMLLVGWRNALYWMSPLALISIAWWWYARDYPSQHPRVGDAELSLIVTGQAAPEEDVPVSALLKRLFSNREVVLLSLIYTAQGYVFYIFFNWFFHYLVDVRDFSILESGFLTSVPWIVASITTGIGGEVCDRLCQRIGPRWGCRLPCIICMPLSGVFLAAGAMTPDPYWAVAFLTIALGLNMFIDAVFWSGMTFVSGPHAATANGLMNTGANLGGVISAPLVPLLADWIGWQGAIASGSVVVILAAVLWLFVRVDCPMERVVPQKI